jgi:hypothetical protein
MSKTITRLFDSHTQALDAISDLEARGIDHDKISLVSNNTENWHDGHKHAGSERDGPLGDRNGDGENDVAEGAGKGAATGGLFGGGAGLLAGLGMLAIPGLGPVVAAGWLAATAVGAAVGAVAGAATGGLLGALKEAGHTDEEANVYAEGVRRGGALVSVKAHDDEIATVEEVLNARRGVDAAVRGDAYRQSGWTAFDPAATPYSADDIGRERALYGEQRSFAATDDVAVDDEVRRTDRPMADPARRDY